MILLSVFALMWWLNELTPLEMDDYDYMISWSTGAPVTGIMDVLASQIVHYNLWGGRVVVHAIAQLFLWLGKSVFNVANAAMYVIFLLELYAIAKPRDYRFCWGMLLAAHVALFCCVPYFGTVFLWLTGSCNYLWGTTLSLLPLLILRNATENGCFARRGVWRILAVMISFFAGWTNENTAVAVFFILLMRLVLRKINRKHPAAWQWTMLAAQGLGMAFMLVAPGNYARATNVDNASAFPLRIVEVLGYTAVYLGVPIIAVLLLLGLLRALGLHARTAQVGMLLLSACLGALALIASPVISDRSYTGPFALALAAALTLLGDLESGCPAIGLYKIAALPLCMLLAAYGGLQAAQDVSSHARAWTQQTDLIEQAVACGDACVTVHSVESHSRFTMSIMLNSDPKVWPNTSLSKVFGVQIAGE